jgi:DNA adenine methylase
MPTPSELQRPVLLYHGGKWLLAPWIIGLFPGHRNYVEPYGGAGSVLLRKPRSFCEVYNDMDGEVVNLFRVLRDRETCLKLCDQLSLTPFARDEFEAARDISADPVERARQLVVRSYFGFAGTGMLNVNYRTGFRACKRTGRPHAGDWVNFPECLWSVTERLHGVTIENRDAVDIIQQQDDTTTLFYVDPPYLADTRNSASKQYAFEMTDLDHVRLAVALKACKGKVMLSGYASDLYDELYSGWYRQEREHHTGGQSGSVMRTEILWMNYEPRTSPLQGVPTDLPL